MRSSGDHPRMRGEHTVRRRPLLPRLGSSPHARGTLVWLDDDTGDPGIIPACAGNTRAPWPRSYPTRDHPRMRGEHDILHCHCDVTAGSSPHARGTRDVPGDGLAGIGIIPACAGNTMARMTQKRRDADHPRMRGEHHFEHRIGVGEEGSSPHARGTHSNTISTIATHGIIPACAGNTS